MTMSLVDEAGTGLGAVQDAARGLRRCRKRHPGPPLRAVPMVASVGTKGWPSGSNKGMATTSARASSRFGDLSAGEVRIEQSSLRQHGAGDGKQPVGDPAQRQAMAVPGSFRGDDGRGDLVESPEPAGQPRQGRETD